jgi:copper transport protein
MTRVRIGTAAMFMLLLCAGFTAPAFSHAVLMDSSPKAKQMFDTSPADVSVTFNESVGPVFFRILDQAGKEVGNPGEIRLDGTRMIMPLGATLPNGTYLMTYRVISADTHPVGATIPFSVGEPLAETDLSAAAQAEPTSGWTTAVALNRWILYAAMLLAAGSALFLVAFTVSLPLVVRTARVGRVAAVVGAVAYVLAIGFGGAEMVLGAGGAMFQPDSWSRGLASTLMPSAAIGVPAMLLLWWAFGGDGQQPRSTVLLLGALAAIGSFLVTGHAATAAPVWLMATMVGVHLTAIAFWFGALYPLYQSAKLESAQACGALMLRFSKLAVIAVGAVVLSGLVISWTQVQSISNLLGNDYGEGLLRKLILFVAVLGIAAWNKLALTPALERGDDQAKRRIRTTIRVEYALYLLVIGAAMALTLSTPPRALVEQSAGRSGGMQMGGAGFKATVKSADGYSVDIDLSPAAAGENMLMATVKNPAGEVIADLKDLEIVVTLESAGITDVRLKGESVGNGMWHVMIQEMLIPGEWVLEVDAFVSDFDKVQFSTPVNIR